MDVRSAISTYFRSEFSAALTGVKLNDDTELIESGIVDSLGIMKLLQYLEDSFSVRIADDELRPENFATPGTIVSLIEKKLPSR